MNYLKSYIQLIGNAEHRDNYEYTENHHIIPRSFGGTDESWNLVRLTLREHRLAHLLLWKIYGENQIFSVECFYDHNRFRFFPKKTMPRYVRKAIAMRKAELNRTKY